MSASWAVAALGWQYAVRCNGKVMSVHDSRPEAEAAMRYQRALERLDQ